MKQAVSKAFPARDVQETRLTSAKFYHVLEALTEAVIYIMVIATPWLFGTTDRWAVELMNWCGYGAGCLLLVKLALRRLTPLAPPRWNFQHETPQGRLLLRLLAAITFCFLGYIMISAWNARATFVMVNQEFIYHENIAWLPHTYDADATWARFRIYLGLAGVFWALIDWLPGKTMTEIRTGQGGADELAELGLKRPVLPQRLRRLLWVISLNGGLVGLASLIQLIGRSEQFFWSFENRWSRTDQISYGPYPYRGNAAQYFNLVWPIAFGLWWTTRQALHEVTRRTLGRLDGPHLVLLPAVVILAASPMMSLSRGGAMIATGLFAVVVVVLFFQRNVRRRLKYVTLLSFAAAMAIGGAIAGPNFFQRIEEIDAKDLGTRREIRENAIQIARDFPIYGTGSGSFATVYNLYRQTYLQPWHAYLHNDWLQARIGLGWLGFGLSISALVLILGRWFVPGGIVVSGNLVGPLWLSLTGCMIHASFDFPFQIYSILFLFTVCCATLVSVSRRLPEHA